MHRSGTSALTGLLVHLGLDPGASGSLMASTPDNPEGHFEQEALFEANEELLVRLGGRWSGPASFASEELVDLARGPEGASARERFDRTFGEAASAGRAWVWKDPRLCLTLPFWLEVLGGAPGVVLSSRSPTEVARSLEARDGLPVAYGLGLWERYARHAVRHTAALDGHVVHYEELLEDPEPAVDQLARIVESIQGWPPSDAQRYSAATSLIRGHRHQRSEDEALGTLGTPEQVELDALVRPWSPEGGWRVPGSETAFLQAAFDEHDRLSGFEDEVARLRSGLEEIVARKDADYEELVARKDAEYEELVARKDAERQESAARKDGERMDVLRDLGESRAETDHARSDVARLEAEVDELLARRWEWLRSLDVLARRVWSRVLRVVQDRG